MGRLFTLSIVLFVAPHLIISKAVAGEEEEHSNRVLHGKDLSDKVSSKEESKGDRGIIWNRQLPTTFVYYRVSNLDFSARWMHLSRSHKGLASTIYCCTRPHTYVQDHYGVDGHHDDDYDHDAFLGHDQAEEFEHLSPEESMERLAKIVDRIDKDEDGYVTFDEMRAWIQYTQRRYVAEDVERQWEQHNRQASDMLI